MSQRLTDSRLANLAAQSIYGAFLKYRSRYKAITLRARSRFETGDWPGMQADSAGKLDVYRSVVDQVEGEIRGLLDDRLEEKLVWASMKAVYSGFIAEEKDWDLAESFFNSITRRIFSTVGVDPQLEFVDTDFATPPTLSRHSPYRTYDRASSTAELIREILLDCPFQVPFENLERDAERTAAAVEERLRKIRALRVVERAEVLRSVFYRGQGAYLVGRIISGSHLVPLALALLHSPEGIVVDAVLLEEDDVSVLFSFARSYFHVEVDRPHDLVRFLRSIMPRKRAAELYISIGYHKHGKTELYRDLLRHLAVSDDRFEISRGKRGMIMTVFTMPSYDMVFKVIKDRFAYPKKTTRESVREKYDLVFRHDRAGRLIDAQEFEHLQFDRARFSEDLLEELAEAAPGTVRVAGDHVVVAHAYVERRVIPLDIYIREARPEEARAAVVDYGHAICDLAASNIFPGDMLLKNFGVTRHGRVVFYDYDEICPLTSCRFRKTPRARMEEDELAAEPWFAVDDRDVFPEEFRSFLGLPAGLRDLFCEHFEDLFGVKFWRVMQERIENGEVVHIYPYARTSRLRPDR